MERDEEMGRDEEMSNLLRETISELKEYGKTLDDVVWIGEADRVSYYTEEVIDGYTISKSQFLELANRNYDAGYGGQEVNEHLLVVGKDFWLERHEYDGMEWWEYKTQPIQPAKEKVITTLFPGDD